MGVPTTGVASGGDAGGAAVATAGAGCATGTAGGIGDACGAAVVVGGVRGDTVTCTGVGAGWIRCWLVVGVTALSELAPTVCPLTVGGGEEVPNIASS